MSNQLQQNETGATVEQGFDGTAITRTGDTAATAMAEQAKHAISARYQMAMLNPRSWDTVRANLRRICKHPAFAQTVQYEFPVAGKTVTGPTIRFVEQALREMGNVYIEQVSIYDDDRKSITRVTVMDLERNTTYTQDVTVEKMQERQSLAKNQTALSTRHNSEGRLLYIVATSEPDLLKKRGALISKAIRNGGVRILPPDIVGECMQLCDNICKDEAARDPDAAKKQLIDSFGLLKVSPAMLSKMLGKDIGEATADELEDLRKVGLAIQEGHTTWADIAGSENEPKVKGNAALKAALAKKGKPKVDALDAYMDENKVKPEMLLETARAALGIGDEGEFGVGDFLAMDSEKREKVMVQLGVGE